MYPLLLFLLPVLVASRHFGSRSKPCVPEGEKAFLAIGQDFYSITNYSDSIGVSPHGVMAYISLQTLNGSIAGLEEPINYGSGIEWVAGLTEHFSYSFLQVGVYLVDACDDVVDGAYDEGVDALSSYLRTLHVPVFLRLGYEFDTAINHYPPDSYRAAFRYIASRFRSAGLSHVALVWHASGEDPRDGMSLAEWFPGNDVVDWCGVSIFQQPYHCAEPYGCVMEPVERVLRFCSARHIPIMIAESTPYGGIIDRHSHSHPQSNINGAGQSGVTWNRWFIPVLQLISRYNIKMWSYISCEWDEQPMWRREVAKGQHWGDTRVQSYSETRRRWLAEVVQSPRFFWVPDPASYFDATCESIPPPQPRKVSPACSSYIRLAALFGIAGLIGYTGHYYWVQTQDNRRYMPIIN